MNTSSLTNGDQLALLKSNYFEALATYNQTFTDEALSKLFSTEDAYMSFIETGDVRSC